MENLAKNYKKLIYSRKDRSEAEAGHLKCPEKHNEQHNKYERHSASRSYRCMSIGDSDNLRLEYAVKKLDLSLRCLILFTHKRTS